jgi:hypothetical protein
MVSRQDVQLSVVRKRVPPVPGLSDPPCKLRMADPPVCQTRQHSVGKKLMACEHLADL